MMIGGEKFHYWPVGDGIATIASGCNGDMFIAENGVLARIGYTDSDAYFFGRAVSEPPPMSEPSSWYVYPNQVERNGAFGNTLELVYLYRRESFTSELTVEDQFLLFGLLVGSNEFIQPL
ncbi:MAG TPA: hypothetical protein DCM08_05910 [Microscillaceae bacterium]|jgi:hypothetical protein|nr:hypothetical protein [Microscillaceae bacterium]